MYNMTMFLYTTFLFFVLTPGILLTLPNKKNKYITSFVHAFIFALIMHVTHKYVWSFSYKEGITPSRAAVVAAILANTENSPANKIKMIKDIGLRDPNYTSILYNSDTPEQKVLALGALFQ